MSYLLDETGIQFYNPIRYGFIEFVDFYKEKSYSEKKYSDIVYKVKRRIAVSRTVLLCILSTMISSATIYLLFLPLKNNLIHIGELTSMIYGVLVGEIVLIENFVLWSNINNTVDSVKWKRVDK